MARRSAVLARLLGFLLAAWGKLDVTDETFRDESDEAGRTTVCMLGETGVLGGREESSEAGESPRERDE